MNPFRVGDQAVRRSTGEPGVVVAVNEEMCEVALPGSGKVWLNYEDLDADASDPLTGFLSQSLHSSVEYGLRLQAMYLEYAYKFDPSSGLSNARVELKPHQVFLAHRIGRKPRARMILADEVGLGKTIEAGLVMKEQIARGLAERVLVICPASLQIQWQRELKSKFNEDFTILDGESARLLEKSGKNPWSEFNKVITSIHLARRETRALQITEATWDLVVFDEAHHARRKYDGSAQGARTQAYQLMEELKELVNGLLLLSATPMQLHPFELFSLIELVEPGLYPSFAQYNERRTSLPALNDLMRDLQEWETLAMASRGAVFTRHAEVLGELGVLEQRALDDRRFREEAIDSLTEMHPLSQVLVRNRKAVIGGFMKRIAKRVPVVLSPEEREVYEEVSEYIADHYNKALRQKNQAIGFLMVLYQKMLASSSNALRESFKKRVTKLRGLTSSADVLPTKSKRMSESEIEDLRERWDGDLAVSQFEEMLLGEEDSRVEILILDRLIGRLGKLRDSKAAVLIDDIVGPILELDPNEKILVFTTFKQTQSLLADYLRQAGIPTTLFHGGMPLVEKEESVQRFRNEAQVMISTEAGGEGRNFQFARNLVNYDLPWNPMVVEQRIGRLDRIGQEHDVRIFNLSSIGTVEDRVLSVLDERIGLFEESVGSLDPILGDVETSLEGLIMTHSKTFESDLEEFGIELENKVKRARESERVLSDFLLDRASFRSDEAHELLSREPLARWSDLRQFTADSLEYHGGRLSEHSEGGDSLTLSTRLRQTLRVGDGTNRGAFDPAIALKFEELDFFAVGHPLIDSILGQVAGNGAVTGARRLASAPKGTSIEVVYQLESNGLVPTGKLVRHLVSEDLTLTEQDLQSLPEIGNHISMDVPVWASDAIAVSKSALHHMQRSFRQSIEIEHDKHRSSALDREDRLYAYQKQFLQQFVEEKEEWVRQVEEYGSRNKRRILPAVLGKIRRYKDKLADLDDGHKERLASIHNQKVDVISKVVAVGLVVGE